MSGFYFSSMPKFKIRCGGVVDDIPSLLPVPVAASVTGVVIQQPPEPMVSSSSFIPLAPEVTSRMLSVLFSAGPVSSLENFGRPGKRKAAADNNRERFVPGMGMEGARGFQRTGQGCRDAASETEDRAPDDWGRLGPLFLLLVNMNIST
ncbi:Uncharacterized protein Fot_24335 [Forsythia ovata]|uniref:Uncharacterized protein n=1 Tax=Forsythia ovata TaxID=205694 RepID=A0ABD1U606_9LAMI